MANRYILDVAFPVSDMEQWQHGTDLLTTLAEPGECESSGTGFGLRDMQFTFTSQAERDLAATRIKMMASHLNLDYVSEYTEDEEGYQIDEYGKRCDEE